MTRYLYRLEGQSSKYVYNKHKDEKDRSDLEFPVSAFRAFCKRKGIPFPLDSVEENLNNEVDHGTISTQFEQKEQDGRSEVVDIEKVEIIEGVTVGDMRKIFNRGAPLDEIVRVLVGHSKLPKDAQTKDRLDKALKNSAKRIKWGTDKSNEISNVQLKGVDLLFFPPTKGGRNNTKDYSI